jgi:hypothetical protein
MYQVPFDRLGELSSDHGPVVAGIGEEQRCIGWRRCGCATRRAITPPSIG